MKPRKIAAGDRKIRVCHVLTDKNIGGAGKWLYYFLSEADFGKFEYRVILPADSAVKKMLEGLPVEITQVPGLDSAYKPKNIRLLRRIFKETAPDIVHTHASVSARIAAARASVPAIILTKHCSDLPPRFFRRFPGRLLGRIHFARTLTMAIATDDSAAYALHSCGLPAKKIRTVYNGALPLEKASAERCNELRRKLGIPDNSYILGYFGRLEPEKGVDNLLRAASLLLRQTENLYFIIVGTGSTEQELKALSKRFGIADRVIFTGFANDIAPYMSLCALNLNCSVAVETSSLAAIEGMSIGLMPVMTDIGGSERICLDCGVTVPPDDPPAMAAAILELLRDPGQIQCMSERCKNKYKAQYTAGRMAKETESVYTFCIGSAENVKPLNA